MRVFPVAWYWGFDGLVLRFQKVEPCFLLASALQTGKDLAAGVDPALELLFYFGVVGVGLYEFQHGAGGEGCLADVEDEGCQGIELVLVDVQLQAVQAGFDFLDIMFKQIIGLSLRDGVIGLDTGGVAIADGENAGRAAVGTEAKAFKVTDYQVGVWGRFHGVCFKVLYKDRDYCA